MHIVLSVERSNRHPETEASLRIPYAVSSQRYSDSRPHDASERYTDCF